MWICRPVSIDFVDRSANNRLQHTAKQPDTLQHTIGGVTPDPLAVFKGPTSKGEGEGKEMKGKAEGR